MKKVILPLLVSCMLLASMGCEDKRPELTLLETQVRKILELPSVEMLYRDIIYQNLEKTFLFIKTSEKEVLFAINIRIQAGYDLQDGFNIKYGEDNTLYIWLPEPKILIADADDESITQYFLKEKFDMFQYTEFQDIIHKRVEAMKKDAIERGIFTSAEDNTHGVLRDFFSLMGFENIVFKNIGDTEGL